MVWERRARPRPRRTKPEQSIARGRILSLLEDVLCSVPASVVPLALALDGLVGAGSVFYAPAWSFYLPMGEATQALGAALLFPALLLLAWCAYLTAKYVYGPSPQERQLLQNGPYRFVRHPMYLSFMLLSGGLILLGQNYLLLLTAGLLTAARHFHREEAELVQLYGDAYLMYRHRTGAFLPPLHKKP